MLLLLVYWVLSNRPLLITYSYAKDWQTTSRITEHHCNKRLGFTTRIFIELLYHQNAQAQAESLLAAERQQSQKILQEQTHQWEAALQQVVRGGEEAVKRERTLTVEAEGQTNIFRLEHQEALQEIASWEEWCQTEPAEEAEISDAPQEQEPLQGYPGLPTGSSPLTPPVMQQQTLLSRHLPPTQLPFQDLAARESENSMAAEIAQEQASARAVLAEAEASASHQQLAREDELRQARQTVRLLEEGRVGSGAPSFTPTLTPPIQPGFTSQLTIGQPQPVTPSPGTLRGPWAATRERLQQTLKGKTTPICHTLPVEGGGVAAIVCDTLRKTYHLSQNYYPC